MSPPRKTPPPPERTPDDRDLPRHPIGVVCRRTGLKPDLVRAWENRYAAVTPGRTATERRLYSEADIERLRLLALATRGGRGIGSIAHLGEAELRSLIAADAAASRVNDEAAGPATTVAGLRDACLDAVGALDGPRLRWALEHAAAQLPRRDLIEKVLGPLVERVGSSWESGSIRPVHEHVATAVIATFVAGLRPLAPSPQPGPVLVVATPPGQRHELGAQLVAATAANEGWTVTYLGPDLPADDIALAARSAGARAVALSLVFPDDDPAVGPALRRLRQQLPPDVALLAGGRASAAYDAALEAVQAIRPGDLAGLRQALGVLRAAPPGRAPRTTPATGH